LSRSFAADTALETLDAGVFRAVVPEHWFIVTGPNGGWIAAVITRAMTEATGRSPRSLTVHFLDAPVAGPVEIRATVERAGGSTSFVTLRMEQDGRPMALGLGICADWREGLPEWNDIRMPEVPRPDDAFKIDGDRTAVPGFWANYDGRGVSGVPRQGDAVPAVGWIRTATPHPLDAPLVAALTDAWLPAAFVRWPEPVIVPTLDLTIHWRAPLPVEGWALLVMRTTNAAGGVWEEDGEVWAEDGTLLAQSRQLAIVRRPKP
jgi:acyl-CoA thioesterase